MPDLPAPACETDVCDECAPHDPHLAGDCMAGVINRDGLMDVCNCIGGTP